MPTMSKKTRVRPNKSLKLDQGENEEFSLKNFFFSDNKPFTDHMLTILKKRKVFISKPRLKQIEEERRKNKPVAQFYDRYNDLIYFDGVSVNLIISMLFAILDYNHVAQHESNAQFLCFFRPLLKRQASLVAIQ